MHEPFAVCGGVTHETVFMWQDIWRPALIDAVIAVTFLLLGYGVVAGIRRLFGRPSGK